MSATFSLGQLMATPGAIKSLSQSDIMNAIRRHLSGDWGDLCEEDKQQNDLALEHGSRLLSAYHSAKGTKFWIITEADRSVTTILLPSEY